MREEFKTTFATCKAMEPTSIRFSSTFSTIKWLFEKHGLLETDTVGDMLMVLEDLCGEYDNRVGEFEVRR